MKKPKIIQTALASYTCVGVIGDGGSGTVYEVVDEDGQVFAAKVLTAEPLSSKQRKRFKNEMHFCLAARLPHVVQALDYGTVADGAAQRPFYLMKRYPRTLRDEMNGSASGDGSCLSIGGKV